MKAGVGKKERPTFAVQGNMPTLILGCNEVSKTLSLSNLQYQGLNPAKCRSLVVSLLV
jgi:hypothetical protein